LPFLSEAGAVGRSPWRWDARTGSGPAQGRPVAEARFIDYQKIKTGFRTVVNKDYSYAKIL